MPFNIWSIEIEETAQNVGLSFDPLKVKELFLVLSNLTWPEQHCIAQFGH